MKMTDFEIDNLQISYLPEEDSLRVPFSRSEYFLKRFAVDPVQATLV